MQPTTPEPPRKRWYSLTLTQQIVVGLIFGVLVGWLVHQLPQDSAKVGITWLSVPRDVFLRLIKAMIAPLIFASVVQGIAGTDDIKKVGRLGVKTFVYFEVITTPIALFFALLVVNLLQPGAGVVLPTETLGTEGLAKPQSISAIIVGMFPTSLLDAMARNDVLQIVVFAVVFAAALSAAGDAGRPVLSFVASLTQVMFKFAGVIMRLAPLGVGAAIAVTIAQQGVGSLLHLGKLVLTLYLALILFVVLGLGAIIRIFRIPLAPFVRAMREPFTLAFTTANSEAALPKAFETMEKFGVPRGIVGFVLPTGYSFNLDGSTLHLAVASVFVAQAAENSGFAHFGLWQQLVLLFALMMTSKGVAAVPRASFVVLVSTIQSFDLPLAGAALILGVDALLDMARTSVNVLGNCLASVVVARWEGEFDEAKAHANFGPPPKPA